MKIRFFVMYLILYWLLGIAGFVFLFGYDVSIRILWDSPFHGSLSGSLIFSSSLLASLIIFYFKNKTLSVLPYDYLAFGFHVGNLSLFIIFVADSLLRNIVVWKYSDFIYFFIGTFAEMILAFISGFAFLAIIPSTASAFILYLINNKFCKK